MEEKTRERLTAKMFKLEKRIVYLEAKIKDSSEWCAIYQLCEKEKILGEDNKEIVQNFSKYLDIDLLSEYNLDNYKVELQEAKKIKEHLSFLIKLLDPDAGFLNSNESIQ